MVEKNMKENNYAPIVLFAFNRLDPLKRCVASLLENSEASETDLIVYVDGARPNKEGEAEKVDAVRQYVRGVTGFKSVEMHFSEQNKKLGPSIIAGVTEVVNKYGRAIVIEDDLVLSRNYLSFMNQCLDLYEKNMDVFSVCGYSIKLKIPRSYRYDIYFGPRSNSWGWATWKNRWDLCDWKLEDWVEVEKKARAFNRWGGSNCFSMLKAWKQGHNQSWAIRFCYNQFLRDAVTVFPVISHVDNEGFDGEGTNCKKFNRYKFEFDISENKDFVLPESIVIIKSITRQRLWYNSLIMRAYSRIMNIIYEKFK